MTILYLTKKNDRLTSHCQCETGLVGDPGQRDCPWCGCGWLFSCALCKKAFSFAVAVEVDKSWEEIARQDLRRQSGKIPSPETVGAWIDHMQGMLKHIKAGETYVYLDGHVIPAHAANLEIEGWHARHRFAKVPHLTALYRPEFVDTVLGHRGYWMKNALERIERDA